MVFRETETIELKKTLNEKVERALVAFLNTQGGIIYIGVEDNGNPVGVDKLDETLKDIADIITTQILPNPQEYVELGTKFIDGKHIIEIKVNKGMPYTILRNTVVARMVVLSVSVRAIAV